MFELTVPDGTNIEIQHNQKINKYFHFTNEMTGYKCNVTCFEISSLGFITPRNNNSLKQLHKFITPIIKLSRFKEDISSLAIYSSYHIFLCRSETIFSSPPYLEPHNSNTKLN